MRESRVRIRVELGLGLQMVDKTRIKEQEGLFLGGGGRCFCGFGGSTG